MFRELNGSCNYPVLERYRHDYTLQSLEEIPYGKWRDYDPEEAVRFYALRMRELKMIKSTPQHIITHGTDWRFLTELKKELKT
jgi:NitT/TauT family transport system substrate-binding protein